MLDAEINRKNTTFTMRRISNAKFPYIREWHEIDEKINPSINFEKLKAYSCEKFDKNANNICIVGAPGLGKTHSLIAIGMNICRLGYDVLFYTSCDLVIQLEEAQKKMELTRIMDKLVKCSFLIVDELGFVPFSEQGARLLFEVFSKRYQRAPTAVSTNLSFEKWGQIFGGIELTTALVDKFIHKCDVHVFKGKSLRLLESTKGKNI